MNESAPDSDVLLANFSPETSRFHVLCKLDSVNIELLSSNVNADKNQSRDRPFQQIFCSTLPYHLYDKTVKTLETEKTGKQQAIIIKNSSWIMVTPGKGGLKRNLPYHPTLSPVFHQCHSWTEQGSSIWDSQLLRPAQIH